jgi:hypothetical protein
MVSVKAADLDALQKRYETAIDNQKQSINGLKDQLMASRAAANGAELVAAVLLRRLLAAEGSEAVVVTRAELVAAERGGVDVIERDDGAVVLRAN